MNDLPANMSMGQTPPPQPNLTAANPQQVSQQVEQKAQEWLKQHQDVPSLLSRKRLSLTLGGVAVILVVVVPVTVWLVSQQQQLAELRSRATSTASPGPVISPTPRIVTTEVSSNTTPYGVKFDVYSNLYSENVDNRWVMADGRGATGTIYFKYDQAMGKSILFSRWDNLNLPEGRVARLWLMKDGKYTWAGELDFEYRQEPVVGYGIYSDSEDFRTYDSLALSFDPYENLASPPTQIVMSVDIQTE